MTPKWKPARDKAARRRQYERCGSACFLKPPTGYPVCPARSCKPSCRGALAARSRAITQRDCVTERKAIRLGKRLGCEWAKGSSSTCRVGQKRR